MTISRDDHASPQKHVSWQPSYDDDLISEDPSEERNISSSLPGLTISALQRKRALRAILKAKHVSLQDLAPLSRLPTLEQQEEDICLTCDLTTVPLTLEQEIVDIELAIQSVSSVANTSLRGITSIEYFEKSTRIVAVTNISPTEKTSNSEIRWSSGTIEASECRRVRSFTREHV
mmetsp:Transcript_38607/g.62542  ORF Transcript_38607/g.62542 Transcript_38607/m.62542 type:complete len:175 (+) Transcript_38607:403-927(+)